MNSTLLSQVQIGEDIDGEAANDASGYPVSLSGDGNRLATAAILNDGNGTSSGHVRIFDWSGSSWNQIGSDIDGESSGDLSGFFSALSLDGNRIAIGAKQNSGVNGLNSGHVRVFEWNGTEWTQLGSDIDGEAENDEMGTCAISADGSIVAVSSAFNEGGGIGYGTGHVRIYEWSGTEWIQMGSNINGESSDDLFGSSLSLSADGFIIAVGAYGVSNNSGQVRSFEWNGSEWIQFGGNLNGNNAGDEFGTVRLSHDGLCLAVGATQGGPNNEGQVQIFELQNANWVQKGNSILGENSNDKAASLAINSNGLRIAIGASGSNNDTGKTRVFDWNGSDWVQFGNEFIGDDNGDNFGLQISLSSLGDVLAIGAYNANFNNSGHVKIFNLSETNPTLNLSSAILEENGSLIITGSSYTPGGLVELTLTGNGEVQFFNPTVTSDGTITHTLDHDPNMTPGLYYVQAYDAVKEQSTPTFNFLIEGEESSDLVITKNFENYTVPVNQNFSITWKDKLLYDANLTSNTTGLRSYHYKLNYSQDGGVSWSDPNPASGSSINFIGEAPVGDVVTFNAQISIETSSPNTLVRVLDLNDTNRQDESEAFEILPANESPHVVIQRKFDHSFPIDVLTDSSLLEDANGVAADGVARILLKVTNNTPTNPIVDMTIELLDEDDGFGVSSDMLGALLQATVFDEYSDEANSATEIGLTASISSNEHEYYFWYVAPQDFNQNHGLYNSRSSRVVTARFDITYQDGYSEEISKNIEIVRPPLMLIHGLASNSNTWDQFKYFSTEENKFIEGSEFSVVKAIDIHPHNSFYENAKLLLNVEFIESEADGNGIVPIEPNSYQGMIYDMRKKGYAANQVDCVTHSMGGSVVRESMFLPEYYTNNISYQYNNYGEGYVNKFITLNTPHNGSPLADLFTDWANDLSSLYPCNGNPICNLQSQVFEYLGEELVTSYVLNNSNSFFSQFISTELVGGVSGHELEPTDAVLDLRKIDGSKFFEATLPSHAIAGDLISGSITNYNNLFQNALQFGQDFNEFVQRFMDFFYANVKVPSASELLILSAEKQAFWNALSAAKEISDKTTRLLTWFETLLTAYQVFDFIQDSDFIVGVESQLSLLTSADPNITIEDGIGHSGPWGPLQNLDIGNNVFDLLNTGVLDPTFGNLPSTQDGSNNLDSSDSDSNSRFTNPLDPDDLFQQIEPGMVENGLEFIAPNENDQISVGEQVFIEVNPIDTVGMRHLSIYFQHEGYFFLPPFEDIELTVQAGGTKLNSQEIIAVALYDYKESLGIDSTAYAIAEVAINIESDETLQDFKVSPVVSHMIVDEHLAPEYLAIYESFVSQIESFDTELTAVVDDPSIVEFNEVTKEFIGLFEGSTFADVTYNGLIQRIFFNITEPCLYPDRNALIELYNDNPNNWLSWDINSCNICEWEGVTCNQLNRVVDLDIANKGISGILTNSIAELTELVTLDISANNILFLPLDFNQLVKLEFLDAGGCSIHSLSSNLADLTNLKYLDLENNNLDSNPINIFVIHSLEYLDIGGNNLLELPPGIEDLTDLLEFHISDNLLTDLPAELDQLENLIEFRASQNQLSSFPVELFSLINLEIINLDQNLITNVPPDIQNLSKLIYLSMDNNLIATDFPVGILSLNDLVFLSLYDNLMTGNIPSNIEDLSSLTQLLLYNNEFTGSIPASLGNMHSLIVLYLHNNNLTGCIPNSLQYFCNSNTVVNLTNSGIIGGGDFNAFCSDGTGNCDPCTTIIHNPNSDGYGSMRHAIGCVADGGAINVGKGLRNSVIELDTPEILVDKNITITHEFIEDYSITISNEIETNSDVLIKVVQNLIFDKINLIGTNEDSFIIEVEGVGTIEVKEGEMEKISIEK